MFKFLWISVRNVVQRLKQNISPLNRVYSVEQRSEIRGWSYSNMLVIYIAPKINTKSLSTPCLGGRMSTLKPIWHLKINCKYRIANIAAIIVHHINPPPRPQSRPYIEFYVACCNQKIKRKTAPLPFPSFNLTRIFLYTRALYLYNFFFI